MKDLPAHDDFFELLDKEIAASAARDNLRKARDLAKTRANTPSLSREARLRASEEFREASVLLAAEEWRAISTSALFAEQACDGCGSIHRNFLQFMEVRVKIKNPSTKLWSRVSVPRADLPRELMVQKSVTHICADCCGEHNFEAETFVLIRDEPFSQSSTYHQEDLNAQT